MTRYGGKAGISVGPVQVRVSLHQNTVILQSILIHDEADKSQIDRSAQPLVAEDGKLEGCKSADGSALS